MDIVVCATDPNCTIIFEFRSAEFQPFTIEFVNMFRCTAFVPIAFVNTYLLTAMYADATVTKEVWRIGKDSIYRIVFYICKPTFFELLLSTFSFYNDLLM